MFMQYRMETIPAQRREDPVPRFVPELERVVKQTISAVRESRVLASGWQIGYTTFPAVDEDRVYNGIELRLVIVTDEEYRAASGREEPRPIGPPESVQFEFGVGAQSVVVYYVDGNGLLVAKNTWNTSNPDLANRSASLLFHLQLYIAARLNVGATDRRVADFTLENMTDVPARAASRGGIYGLLDPDERGEGHGAFVGKTLAERIHISEGEMRLPMSGDVGLLVLAAISGLGSRVDADRPPWSRGSAARFATLRSYLAQYSGGSKKRRRNTRRGFSTRRRRRTTRRASRRRRSAQQRKH